MSAIPLNSKRRATHSEADLNRLMKLGCDIDDLAEDDEVDHDALVELGEDSGVDIELLYAAAALTTDVQIKRESEISFTVCAAKCQNWGALSLIEHLTKRKEERSDEGGRSFDIVVKPCLDRCDKAAVVIASSPSGKAMIDEASTKDLDEAITALCG